jgi:hypothetical protein
MCWKTTPVKSSVVPTPDCSEKFGTGRQHFHGALPGPRAGSRSVALQAKVGKKWRTFKQLTTDSRGRFKGKYKFLSTFGTVRYRFRALVKRQGGYLRAGLSEGRCAVEPRSATF